MDLAFCLRDVYSILFENTSEIAYFEDEIEKPYSSELMKRIMYLLIYDGTMTYFLTMSI